MLMDRIASMQAELESGEWPDAIGFTKVRAPFGWLGNMSPHPVTGPDGARYWTAEALFQSMRFAPGSLVIELLQKERNPMAAKMLARKHLGAFGSAVAPQSEADLSNMLDVLTLKIAQHSDLAEQLAATGGRKIVEDVTARRNKGSAMFWGAARTPTGWEGRNALGALWMILRDRQA